MKCPLAAIEVCPCGGVRFGAVTTGAVSPAVTPSRSAASSRRGSKAFENETWRYQASYGVLSVASPAPNYPMSDEQYRKVARECLEWPKQARTELERRDFSRHGGGQYARGC